MVLKIMTCKSIVKLCYNKIYARTMIDSHLLFFIFIFFLATF